MNRRFLFAILVGLFLLMFPVQSQSAPVSTGTDAFGGGTRAPRSLFKAPNGNYYLVAGAYNAAIRVYKGGTDGSSWTEKDDTHAPASVTLSSFGADIDSNGVIGILYPTSASVVSYAHFHTADDTWDATIDTVKSSITTAYTVGPQSLVFDTSNKPHGTFGDSASLYYTNKVGTDWTVSPVLIDADGRWPSIITNSNDSDKPYILFTDYSTSPYYTILAIGNTNDASSFTNHNVSNSGSDNYYRQASMAMDSSGDIWVARANSLTSGASDLTVHRHIHTNDYDTWETAIPLGAGGDCKSPSVVANGTDIYVFATKMSDTKGIWYFTSKDSWNVSGHQIETESNGYDVTPVARWGIRNNPSYGTRLDYIFENTNDSLLYYNYVTLGAPTTKGNMFLVW